MSQIQERIWLTLLFIGKTRLFFCVKYLCDLVGSDKPLKRLERNFICFALKCSTNQNLCHVAQWERRVILKRSPAKPPPWGHSVVDFTAVAVTESLPIYHRCLHNCQNCNNWHFNSQKLNLYPSFDCFDRFFDCDMIKKFTDFCLLCVKIQKM